MLYLALGGAALTLYLWVTGGKPKLKRREWRFIAGAAAVVAFTAAAFAGTRGAWGPTIVLIVMGLWLASTTRQVGAPARPPPRSSSSMSLGEARHILGVGEEADAKEIQAAYSRLMRAVHPDKGGTAGLAAQLNAARDRLLKK